MNESRKPKRGRPQKLDADKTLSVAMHAYWKDDPADVSLNAVCTLADVSKPALYRQFGGEDPFVAAVLEKYAQTVLSEIFEILQRKAPLQETLDALIHFATKDPKMETGCVFYKMRAGKHRLGPKSRAVVENITSAAINAFESYLVECRDIGALAGSQTPELLAQYLFEQIGLALTQRAAGEDPAQIRAVLTLAFAVFRKT